MKKIIVRSISAIALLLHGAAYAAVEVLLKAPLDEPRGYCIDVVGPQARADISRPLQAHSCYSYQGKVAVDQGFDPVALQAGVFRLIFFNVCMSAARGWLIKSCALHRRSGPEICVVAVRRDRTARRARFMPDGRRRLRIARKRRIARSPETQAQPRKVRSIPQRISSLELSRRL